MSRIRNEVQSLKVKAKWGSFGLLPGALRWTVAGLQREERQRINILVFTADLFIVVL
jgi:hypothetical protein